MPYIRNVFLAGMKQAPISTERVDFDENGVGFIESQELYNEILQLPNFEPSETPKDKEQEPKEQEPKEQEPKEQEPKAGEPKEEEPKVEDAPQPAKPIDQMTHKELDVHALEELGVPKEEYPSNGKLDEKVEAITAFQNSQSK